MSIYAGHTERGGYREQARRQKEREREGGQARPGKREMLAVAADS